MFKTGSGDRHRDDDQKKNQKITPTSNPTTRQASPQASMQPSSGKAPEHGTHASFSSVDSNRPQSSVHYGPPPDPLPSIALLGAAENDPAMREIVDNWNGGNRTPALHFGPPPPSPSIALLEAAEHDPGMREIVANWNGGNRTPAHESRDSTPAPSTRKPATSTPLADRGRIIVSSKPKPK
ncbi:hypothetical protein FQN57_004421 [Myotisia sp. PD_48]|nr:hypothetical protein FQN57_004421 [Myotisia sp. PD_48]